MGGPKKVTHPGVVPPSETVEAIQKMGDAAAKSKPEEQEQAAQKLAAMIQKEGDPLIRIEILRAVTKCRGATSERVLTAAVKDPDADVRVVACQALSKQGASSVAVLSDTLRNDIDPDVRLAAAKALGETRDPNAVAALGVALNDANPAMQYRAVMSLRSVTHKDLGNDVRKWQEYVNSVAPPPAGGPETAVAGRPNPTLR